MNYSLTSILIVLLNINILSQLEKSTAIILAEEYFVKDDCENALKYLHEAWDSGDTLSINVAYRIASCYYRQEKFKTAIEWYKRAIYSEYSVPMLAAQYSCLGWSYEYTMNHTKAIECFKLAEEYGISYPSEFMFEDEGWYYITYSNYDHIYYKKKSIKNIEGKYKQVWTKWYWDENSMSEKDLKRLGQLGGTLEAQKKLQEEILLERKGVKYSLLLFEFDCRSEKMRILSGADYATDGSVIHSDDMENDWSYIIPGSVSEIIASKICK